MSFDEFISVLEDKSPPRRKTPKKQREDSIIGSSHHSPGKSIVHQSPAKFGGFTPGHRSSSLERSILEDFNRSGRAHSRRSSSVNSAHFAPTSNVSLRGPTQFSLGRSPSANGGQFQHSPLANSTFSSNASSHFFRRKSSSVISADFAAQAAHSSYQGNLTELDETNVDNADLIRYPGKEEESLLEWFDKSMEKELEKHRTDTPELHLADHSGMGHRLIADATASILDIDAGLRSEMDTELIDAADKFAIAEAVVTFEGAVRAAEAAASKAPPELAEEAAAAGARGFQAELTSAVRQKIHGTKPVEVLGYIGITKPKTIKRS